LKTWIFAAPRGFRAVGKEVVVSSNSNYGSLRSRQSAASPPCITTGRRGPMRDDLISTSELKCSDATPPSKHYDSCNLCEEASARHPPFLIF
jgi:hypothetical protein